MLKFEGDGYEFNAIYYGGAFDGLNRPVISFKETPPIMVIHKMNEELKDSATLGERLLSTWKEKHLPDDERIAVYKIEGEPEEYDHEDDVVPYHFKEIMEFGDYKEKYQ